MAVDRKPDSKTKQPKQDYPPWSRETDWERTTTVTVEGRQIPQPGDKTFQTSMTVQKKGKKPTVPKKPQVATATWMKDTDVDKTTSVTKTVSVRDETQGYPSWIRETEVDRTTTVTAYSSTDKPQDQTYDTTIVVPGKQPVEKERKEMVKTEKTIQSFPGPLQKGVILAEKKLTKPVPAPKPTKAVEPGTKTLPADKPVGIGIHSTDISTRTVHEKFPTAPPKLVIPVEELKLTIPVRRLTTVQSPYPHEDYMLLEAVFASPWKPSTDTVSEAVIRLEQSRLELE